MLNQQEQYLRFAVNQDGKGNCGPRLRQQPPKSQHQQQALLPQNLPRNLVTVN